MILPSLIAVVAIYGAMSLVGVIRPVVGIGTVLFLTVSGAAAVAFLPIGITFTWSR